MTRLHPRTVGLLLACIAALALPAALSVVQAQERTPPAIVDGVVDAMCQKQIVLLGEPPTHGEALAFDAKSKITERLIAKCGFTAVLFEAPVYDFIGFERAANARTATPDQLDNAIGRFWLTRELAPWRRSLFDAASQRRVTIGGIDDQVSITSRYAVAELPRLIAAASAESTAAECRATVNRNLGYTYDAAHPFDDGEQAKLQGCARNAANAAAANASIDAADRVMLESFARYADRQHVGVTSRRSQTAAVT